MVERNQVLTLYWDPISQPARAVKAALDMGHIQFTLEVRDVFKGETKTEEYLAMNPKGLVPFIVDGDHPLGESNDILKYLCETRSTIPESLWPKDATKRAVVASHLEWYLSNLRPATLQPLLARLFHLMKGAELSDDVTTAQKEAVEIMLSTLESLLQ